MKKKYLVVYEKQAEELKKITTEIEYEYFMEILEMLVHDSVIDYEINRYTYGKAILNLICKLYAYLKEKQAEGLEKVPTELDYEYEMHILQILLNYSICTDTDIVWDSISDLTCKIDAYSRNKIDINKYFDYDDFILSYIEILHKRYDFINKKGINECSDFDDIIIYYIEKLCKSVDVYFVEKLSTILILENEWSWK